MASNLSNFNSGMAAYNAGKIRKDGQKAQWRRELISEYAYAVQTGQPLPEPVKPGKSVSWSPIKTIKLSKENERLKAIMHLESTEFARFRADYTSGALSQEAALGWLNSLK